MRACVREAEHRAGIAQQRCHLIFVRVRDRQPESRLQIALNREIQRKIDRVASQFCGYVAHQPFPELRPIRTMSDDRFVPCIEHRATHRVPESRPERAVGVKPQFFRAVGFVHRREDRHALEQKRLFESKFKIERPAGDLRKYRVTSRLKFV